VQSPLVLDVVDLVNGRSVGGCSYHVIHPGGRGYDRFPVNAAEADARRGNRFTVTDHTPGPIDVARLRRHRTLSDRYPRTLDLRQPRS
jgi:uncharacterized protein (DUF2126 family)